MTDPSIFAFGCLVTAWVAAAVIMLLRAADHEKVVVEARERATAASMRNAARADESAAASRP